MTSTKTLEKWIAELTANERRMEVAKRRLPKIPVHGLGGHVFDESVIAEQHPFANFAKTSKLGIVTDAIKLDRRIAAIRGHKTVSIGMSAGWQKIVTPCKRCGLFDWTVDKSGMAPFGTCPFPNGIRQTRVVVSVPSGKLAVGVTMQGFFPIKGVEDDIDNRTIDGYDGTNFRSHYTAKLWECCGFAEVETFEQDENGIHRTDDGGIALTNVVTKRRKPIVEIFPFMPRFACCDSVLFAPFYAEQKKQIRSEAVYHDIDVEPGDYSVTVAYGKAAPKIDVSGKKMPARVIVSRIGPPTPFLSFAELEARAKTYLDEHPWLRTKFMGKHFRNSR